MLSQEFMRNALIDGSLTGLACGLVGYFVVLRAQVFAGDALSHVAFVGAMLAVVLGLELRLGLYASTLLVAVLLGLLGRRARAVDDVAIGAVFVWTLGLGALFLALYTSGASAGNGTAGVTVLFGSIFGLDARAVLVDGALAVLASALLLAAVRPLLYASLDPVVARAQGLRVRLLDLGFLALVGLVAAQATQAVGALLLLGLLAAPAGAAQRLTANPYRGLILSALFAVGAVWLGLALAYLIPSLPPSTAIVSVAGATYVASLLASSLRKQVAARSRRPLALGGQGG